MKPRRVSAARLKEYIRMTITTLDDSTFEYLKPTDKQIAQMARVRTATKAYCEILLAELPEGADKNRVIQLVRTAAMWTNVSITRFENGLPRTDVESAC